MGGLDTEESTSGVGTQTFNDSLTIALWRRLRSTILDIKPASFKDGMLS